MGRALVAFEIGRPSRQDMQHGGLVKQSITLSRRNDTSAEKVPAWSAAFMLPATARAVGTRRCLPKAESVCPACCAFAYASSSLKVEFVASSRTSCHGRKLSTFLI